MKKLKRNPIEFALLLVLLTGCAGLERSCSSCSARNFGSDWIVVELTETDGKPYRCWELNEVSITNEEGSDGIYWKTKEGNLMHISGSYDYIQVVNEKWDEAFAEINMTREACTKIRTKKFDPVQNKYIFP